MSDADELAKLAALKDKGIITAREYENKKRYILQNKATSKQPGIEYKDRPGVPWGKVALILVALVLIGKFVDLKDHSSGSASNEPQVIVPNSAVVGEELMRSKMPQPK